VFAFHFGDAEEVAHDDGAGGVHGDGGEHAEDADGEVVFF